MPWSVHAPMSQRLEFAEIAARGLYTVTELCERDGVRVLPMSPVWIEPPPSEARHPTRALPAGGFAAMVVVCSQVSAGVLPSTHSPEEPWCPTTHTAR